MCDLNPLTRNVLASPDAVSSTKILLMKMFIVMAAGCLDALPTVQMVIVALAVVGVCHIHLKSVSISVVSVSVTSKIPDGAHAVMLTRQSSSVPSLFHMPAGHCLSCQL
jgi:hypothetical protein